MRKREKQKTSGTRFLLYVTGGIIAIWCILTPMLLLNQIQTETNMEQVIMKNHGKSVAIATRRNDPPPIVRVGERLWTLRDATLEERSGKDWYELGKLITSKNQVYLSQAEGRATKESSTITLVSGMFDLGRGHLQDSFKRTFDQYVERFSNFLAYKFPKILFIQPEHYHYYVPYLEKNKEYPVYIINTTLDDIRNFKYFDLIQEMREKPGWATQAGWLAESPQASMPLYNPMVMSKLLWTRDAARINPFDTDAFLWFDGGHACNNPEQITQENTEVFKKHFDKLLITYFDYEPAGEVHGFTAGPFRQFCDTKDRVLRVGRGGVFGGTKEYLEVASEVYMMSIGTTLKAGYMGTEENIFSLLYYRFPELVHDYENGDGGNCAIFSEAIYGPPPPPLSEIIAKFGFDLRGLTCKGMYEDIQCIDPRNGKKCPEYVTPTWLTAADNQYVCNLRGHFCTVYCDDSGPHWVGGTCEEGEDCPPHGRVRRSVYYGGNDDYDEDSLPHIHALTAPQRIDDEDTTKTISIAATPVEIEFTKKVQQGYSKELRQKLKKEGYNLRGLECEIKDGKETCFLNHPLGRDVCPPSITSASLTLAEGQWSCTNSGTYCVTVCQDGTPFVHWSAFNAQYCEENPENCAPKPVPIPYEDFVIREWSEDEKPPALCDSLPTSSFDSMPPFSVLVLARGTELESLRFALQTWSEGFMQRAPEFLFFINDRTPEMFDMLDPYTKDPYNIKIRSSDTNHGILEPIKWLIGNATYENVLFLEKDFRLVESLSCTLDQLQAGSKLLDEGVADVVKFRSRYNGGKANWAHILYAGEEETVFTRQPNLLCNFYHWIDQPEKRWPEQFFICNEDPLMYCVDAEFCNWTNNPFFIKKTWWIENYQKKHWEIQSPPDEFDLETWMNWDPFAWNNRGWTIAEGDGMFKHADVFKFGV